MNVVKFSELLQYPNTITPDQIDSLGNIVGTYPFFQAARALYLKGLKEVGNFKYHHELKTTAAYTTDRNVLFEFINTDKYSPLPLKENLQLVQKNENKIGITEKMRNGSTATKPSTKQGNSTKKEVPLPLKKSLAKETSVESSIIGKEKKITKSEDANKIVAKTLVPSKEVPQKKVTLSEKSITEIETSDFSSSDITDTVEKRTASSIEYLQFDLPKKSFISKEEKGDFFPQNITEAEKILDSKLYQRKKEDTQQTIPSSKKDTALVLDKNKECSFNEWLQLSKSNNRKQTADVLEKQTNYSNSNAEKKSTYTDENKKNKFQLINAFIENNPKIVPKKDVGNLVNLAAKQKLPKKELMTETLAEVYVSQKKYKKAIQAYKILSLKYPKKSSFFADQIRKIEKIQQNK